MNNGRFIYNFRKEPIHMREFKFPCSKQTKSNFFLYDFMGRGEMTKSLLCFGICFYFFNAQNPERYITHILQFSL